MQESWKQETCTSRLKEPHKAVSSHQCSRTFSCTMCWISGLRTWCAAIVLLDPTVMNPAIGWRVAFLIGAVLGLVILVMRLWIPESPRWLMTHGNSQHAETIVAEIERRFGLPAAGAQDDRPRVRLRRRTHTSLAEVGRTLFRTYRQRTLVGLTLMAAQAFFYNAIFFTFALVLRDWGGDIAANPIVGHALRAAWRPRLLGDGGVVPLRHAVHRADGEGRTRVKTDADSRWGGFARSRRRNLSPTLTVDAGPSFR